MNWNSSRGQWTPVVGEATKAIRDRALAMRQSGVPVREIARLQGKSPGRIYELTR